MHLDNQITLSSTINIRTNSKWFWFWHSTNWSDTHPRVCSTHPWQLWSINRNMLGVDENKVYTSILIIKWVVVRVRVWATLSYQNFNKTFQNIRQRNDQNFIWKKCIAYEAVKDVFKKSINEMNVSKSQGITSSHDDHGMTNRSKHPPNQPWRERIKVQEQP